MEYEKKRADIASIIERYPEYFKSFTQSSEPNKLISPLKLDGTNPKNSRKDKSYIYLNTGVMVEQGCKSINIFAFLFDYHGVEVRNVKFNRREMRPNNTLLIESKFKPKPSKKISNLIESIDNYMMIIPENVAEGYFELTRCIDLDYLIDFTEKIKYQSTLCVRNEHNVYIPFDENQGYQRIVLNTDFKKQKAETRILLRNRDKQYRTTVMGDINNKYVFLTEGIEDAMSLVYSIRYRYLTHSVLEELFNIVKVDFPKDLNEDNTAVICCYGKTGLVKIAREMPRAIVIADSDTFIDDCQSVDNVTVVVPYAYRGEVCKDFNKFLLANRQAV